MSNWAQNIGTIATMATGNPLAGALASGIYKWVRDDEGDENKVTKSKSGFDTGRLANDLISAQMQKKSTKKYAEANANTGQLNLKKLSADAQASGFNPLTVLRATGGSGFYNNPNAGALASSAFWGSMATSQKSNYKDAYTAQMENNDLKQIKESSNTFEDLNAEFIEEHGVPLMVPVYIWNSETKQREIKYHTINPELMETSPAEAMGSVVVQGLQFTFQNGLPVEAFFDIVGELPTSVKKTIRNLYNEFKDNGLPEKTKLIRFVDDALKAENVYDLIGIRADRTLKQFEQSINHDRNSTTSKGNISRIQVYPLKPYGFHHDRVTGKVTKK